MKRTILILAITLIAATFVFGQSKDEQEIRKMMEMNADAIVKNDTAALSNYTADSLTFTGAEGVTVNKTQYLERIKNSKFESFSFADMNIRVFGNAAVVVANPTFTTIDKNGDRTNVKDHSTMTLVKTGGRWQVVAVHRSTNQADNQSLTEKQIGEVLSAWGNALGRRDAAAVDKILPADFMVMSPDGKLLTSRAEYLEIVKNYPGEATVTGKGEKTIVMGDTAVQSGTYTVTPKAGGANAATYAYTATFVRRNSLWTPIAFNSRAIKQ